MNKRVKLSEIGDKSNIKFGTSGLRGLVEAMTEEICYAYTIAFLQLLKKKYNPFNALVLGHDLRPSSPKISSFIVSALNHMGVNVIYAGSQPTPTVAFYAHELKLPAIIVTGSHIPFNRNGIKFYSPDGEITKDDEQFISNAEIVLPQKTLNLALPMPNNEIVSDYIRRYVDFFGDNKFSSLNIGLYEHSSAARDLIKDLFKQLGINTISLGRTNKFIPIDTEAVREEDIHQAKLWVKEYSLDAIFTTDGDADRPLIADENGRWLRGDIVGILTSKYLNADIVVTPVSSNTALEKSHWFNQVIRTKIGSPFVIKEIEQAAENEKVVVGFEANGGFILGSDISDKNVTLKSLKTRDAILPMLAILGLSKQLNCKISQLNDLLPSRYTFSNRIENFPTEQSSQLIKQLAQDLVKAKQILAPNAGDIVDINTTDGFRVTFSNSDIVHLRPSGNSPELRCYAESRSADQAMLLCNDCLSKIKSTLVSDELI